MLKMREVSLLFLNRKVKVQIQEVDKRLALWEDQKQKQVLLATFYRNWVKCKNECKKFGKS